MQDSLRQESERLVRSWMRHEPAMLRDYLVAGVEDPRINLQSIFSRHFLVRALTGERFSLLMEQECRFAAVMNWLVRVAGRLGDAEEPGIVLYALERGADNAEGIEIPHFVVQAFQALAASAGDLAVPNYIESFLLNLSFEDGRAKPDQPTLETFCRLWSHALLTQEGAATAIKNQDSRLSNPLLSLLEPACGSANDYRFLHASGLARLLNYTGFDLCETNIQNARALFPNARFEAGNVFEISAADKSFDLCLVHDLFEHLSLEGLQTAVKELCRVTRRGLCVGFFNMDEIPEHVVQPVEEYHWNRLSMRRTRELFTRYGFAAQVIHIGTFLRRQIGCEETHNENAYTFVLERR